MMRPACAGTVGSVELELSLLPAIGADGGLHCLIFNAGFRKLLAGVSDFCSPAVRFSKVRPAFCPGIGLPRVVPSHWFTADDWGVREVSSFIAASAPSGSVVHLNGLRTVPYQPYARSLISGRDGFIQTL
jgi:hypothetical protein